MACEKEQIAIDRLKNVEGLLKAEFYCEDCQMKYTIYNVKNFDLMYNAPIKPKHQFGRKHRMRDSFDPVRDGCP